MKYQRGFTLIELMIVVAIIAILAGILIPNFTHARAQAQTAACEANLREIATAFELYYADLQVYPAGTGASIGANALYSATSKVNYLNTVPEDPASALTTDKYSWTTVGGSTPSYVITCPGVHDPSTLTKIKGAATSDTKLTYASGAGLATAP